MNNINQITYLLTKRIERAEKKGDKEKVLFLKQEIRKIRKEPGYYPKIYAWKTGEHLYILNQNTHPIKNVILVLGLDGS